MADFSFLKYFVLFFAGVWFVILFLLLISAIVYYQVTHCHPGLIGFILSLLCVTTLALTVFNSLLGVTWISDISGLLLAVCSLMALLPIVFSVMGIVRKSALRLACAGLVISVLVPVVFVGLAASRGALAAGEILFICW